LYTSESPDSNSEIFEFLNNISIPTLNSAQKTSLDQPIQIEEILNAITLMQSKKTHGPDGYPIDFYKKCADKLGPILLDMLVDSLEKGSLPQTLNEANIILLLKPGKDPLKCNSYRPISLLNSDVKILAKILALRLDTVIENLISKDQTGFVRGQHSFSNIRRLLGVINFLRTLSLRYSFR